jgi:hypothetical protein
MYNDNTPGEGRVAHRTPPAARLYYEGDDPTRCIEDVDEEFPGGIISILCLPFDVPPGQVGAFYDAAERNDWHFGS